MPKWSLSSLLLLLGMVLNLSAQPRAVVVTRDPSPKIGDHIRLQVTVNAPVGVSVEIPTVESVLSERPEKRLATGSFLEFVSQGEASTRSTASYDVTTFEVVVTGFNEGTYTFPALPFAYLDKTDTIWSNSMDIKVVYPNLVSGDSNYLADIKNILPEKKNLSDYSIYLYGLIALLGISSIVAWGIYLTKRLKSKTRKQVPLRTPKEIALQRLEGLKNSDLLAKGEFKVWHTELSLVIREYMQRVLNVSALESTTAQFLSQLTAERLTAQQKHQLKEVLETADLIKFAKASPLEAANNFALASAYELIENVASQEKETEKFLISQPENTKQ